nr:zinc-ribbon domain-containing protein [uncultured Actinoplanes sp.]
MLLIFGFRTKAYPLGWVAAFCHVCGRTGNLLVIREVTKLSLFFIPLIPVRTRYVMECQNPVCRSRTRIDRREARRLLAAGVSPVRPAVPQW